MKNGGMMTSKQRSLLLCAAWTASIILAGSLLWLFTHSLRTGMLLRSANRVIARSGESRRLGAAERSEGFGTWFTLIEAPDNTAAPGQALVFTLMNGTRTASCAAFVGAQGSVEKIIPLSEYAELVLADLPEMIYKIYVTRIEASFRPGLKRERT